MPRDGDSEKQKKQKTFDFKDQLKIGKQGERMFQKFWPYPVRRNEDIKGVDFIDINGDRIEIKSDSYDHEKTPFIFSERWSDYKTQTPGGVYQAVEKGANVYVYQFVKNKIAYIFRDLPALIERLDVLTEHSYAISIRNKGWTTAGYKVLRSDLEDLYEKREYEKK